MCECEKELGLRFLPHQLTYGTEYGTQKRYRVTAFAQNICLTCRGENEAAHPLAYGSKVERYYWREISKTYFTMVLDWLTEKSVQTKDIVEFESRFPKEAKRMKKEAKKIWSKRHKETPKYIIDEPTEANFLMEIKVPEQHLTAKYVEIKEKRKKIRKWINEAGTPCSVEEYVADWYKTKDFSVRRCESRLISILVGTFCVPVILDHNNSIRNALMSGFGSHEFYKSKLKEFEELVIDMKQAKDLQILFEDLLNSSKGLRSYLGVNDNESIELGRIAIRTMPKTVILQCIKWGFQYFWDHRPGWPDLFVFNDNSYLFVEVKSQHDKLSLSQMKWFRWAVQEVNIPCEIVRVQEEGTNQKSNEH